MKNCRVHRNVFRKAGKQRSSSHCIDSVTGVLGVAPDCQPPTAKPQIEVTKSAGRALSEPKVRPRAGGDCRVGFEYCLEFIVINVYAMADQHVGPQDPQLPQVHCRTQPGPGEILLSIADARRKMKRQPCVVFLGQRRCTSDQCVRHEVVPDESHPWRDQWPFVAFDHHPLAVQDLIRRRCEWPIFDVPAPGAEGDPGPNLSRRCRNPVGMGNCASLDGGGDPALKALNQRQGGRTVRHLQGCGWRGAGPPTQRSPLQVPGRRGSSPVVGGPQ